MDGKVSKGTTAYDLVQPTDYTVTLLIRQGLLQPMDHSKLPVLANFNPIYLNLAYDPGNKYTVPYQNSTDSIVVNTAAVKDIPKSWPIFGTRVSGQMVFADDSRTVIGLLC